MFSVQLIEQGKLRFAKHYLDQLKNANAAYRSPTHDEQDGNTIHQFLHDWDQIKQGHQWLIRQWDESQTIARLCVDYADVEIELLDMGQEISDHFTWYETALSAARWLGLIHEEATFLRQVAKLHERQGDYVQAIDLYQQAGLIFDTLKSTQEKATIFNHIGYVHYVMGNYEESTDCHQKSLDLSPHGNVQSNALLGLGRNAYMRSQQTQAKAYIEQCLLIYQEFPELHGELEAYHILGEMAYSMGDYLAAREHYEHLLNISERHNYQHGIMEGLMHLGYIYRDLGEVETAEEVSLRSLDMARRLGDVRSLAIILNSLGSNLQVMGEYDQALGYHQEALDICERIDDRMGMAMLHARIGEIDLVEKRYNNAHHHFEQSHTLFKELDEQWGVAMSSSNLGDLLVRTGEFSSAQPYYEITLNLCESVNDQRGIIVGARGIGECLLKMGKLEEAKPFLLRSYRLALAIEILPMTMATLALLALYYFKAGRSEHALLLLAFVYQNPMLSDDIRKDNQALYVQLQEQLSPSTVEKIMANAGTESFDSLEVDD